VEMSKYRKRYNWKEIQDFYNNGGTYRSITKKYGVTSSSITKAVKRGELKTRSISDSVKLARKKNPEKYIMSEETKKKISISRTKYLKENPDKVPYLLNHYSKGESYPEKYFTEIFDKYNIKYDKFHRSGIYHIDFAIIDNGVAIEIDGEQHYLDEKIKGSDVRKDKFLKDKGWDVFRIRWSYYQKLDREEKEEYIRDLIKYIEGSDNKPILYEKYNKCECGAKISKRSKKCSKCASRNRFLNESKNRPSYTQLLEDIKNTNYTSTGNKYGVSDNAIRKWIKMYEKYNMLD
jgi:very-short-patch-repair endonuclease